MKKIKPVFILLVLFMLPFCLSQTATHAEMVVQGDSWTATWNADFLSTASGVCLDGSGNVYVTGNNFGEVDYDPTENENLVDGETFLSKYTTDGAYLWTIAWDGESNDLVCDSEGNIIVCGNYGYHTMPYLIDLEPGIPESIHTAGTDADEGQIFVSKFNPDGNVIWIRTWESPGLTDARDLAVDGNNNVIVTGDMYGEVDLNPGWYHEDFHLGDEAGDIFVVKLDSVGSYQWGESFGGSNAGIYDDSVYEESEIAVDSDGNIFLAGRANGQIHSDASGNVDNIKFGKTGGFYVCRLDPDGGLAWINGWPSADDGWTNLAGITVNDSGRVFIAGDFMGSPDFDPGKGTDVKDSGDRQSGTYVTCIDNTGGYLWTSTLVGSLGNHPRFLTPDNSGGVIVTGESWLIFNQQNGFFSFNNEFEIGYLTVDYPGSDTWLIDIESDGGLGIYIELDSDGLYTTGGLAIDDEGNVYHAGYRQFLEGVYGAEADSWELFLSRMPSYALEGDI